MHARILSLIIKDRIMKIGIPKESYPGEKRVALVPAHVSTLIDSGLEIYIQDNAGIDAGFTNEDYENKSAKVVQDRNELFGISDVVLQVRAAGANPANGIDDIKLMKEESSLIGFLDPFTSKQMIMSLVKKRITAYAMELIPRITRAQSMDALSTIASISGYKAALMAACALPRMYPMMMTAAGTVVPARVFVIGAGVAGLQAIATAHRIGAVVSAFDIRPAVKEQVQSLGAKFMELNLEMDNTEDKGGYAREMGPEYYRKQQELMGKVLLETDVVIATAAVPGKKAPLLITEEMVKMMPAGSVIVDLAAEQGGNCELTKPGKTIHVNGVTIIGPVNLPSTVPYHASQLYSKNITSFLIPLVKDNCLDIDCPDEIAQSTLITAEGKVINEKIKDAFGI
jgi:NAD(P) transhydrogenase subunit alpha